MGMSGHTRPLATRVGPGSGISTASDEWEFGPR